MPGKAKYGEKNSQYKHGLSGTDVYIKWDSMIGRCYRPTSINYSKYGGRGISVCDEWRHDVEAFVKWAMQNGYQNGLSIDRIDNAKGYCPDNCRWVTHKQQAANRRQPLGRRKSPYIGVERSNVNRWRAYLRVDGKKLHIGTTETAEEAARLHDAEAMKRFGQSATVNGIS
jgi:hypothetical protein